MIRFSTLTVAAAAAIGILLSLANASTTDPVQSVKTGHPGHVQAGISGCQFEDGGRIVQLQPGEGVQVGKGWRNCQVYDGHPVIVHSSEAPAST